MTASDHSTSSADASKGVSARSSTPAISGRPAPARNRIAQAQRVGRRHVGDDQQVLCHCLARAPLTDRPHYRSEYPGKSRATWVTGKGNQVCRLALIGRPALPPRSDWRDVHGELTLSEKAEPDATPTRRPPPLPRRSRSKAGCRGRGADRPHHQRANRLSGDHCGPAGPLYLLLRPHGRRCRWCWRACSTWC